MSHLIASLAWCWVQVLLVSTAAIGLSLLALRRSPTAGATIAWSGVVATLALTGLAIVPLPAQMTRIALGNLVVIPSHNTQTLNFRPEHRSQVGREVTEESGFRAALDGPLIAKLLSSLRNSESAVVRYQSKGRWVLLVLATGSAIGLFRLIGGLVAIAALRRRTTAVTDCGVFDVLRELLCCLPLRHMPQVREASDLDSAAVVGWRRPTVMLPAGWRDWSPAELKAVLAHELAHIARHDAPWRLVAAFTVALHWGQPLMHWLRRHLLLAQELAADELAAAALGSKREYLQALAKLALRQDSRLAVTPPAALLPVFSGFLLRRIVMLRAKDGSMRRNWRLLMQGSALGLVAAVALFATAIRGLAQPPETESDGSIRVAKATDLKARPAVPAADQPAEAGMFQRPPFDIAKMASSKQGGFLMRVGEILQQPRFAKFARENDELLVKSWKDTFPGSELPPFSLKDIEYIAGDSMLTALGRHVSPPKEEKDPNPHQIMFGTQCGFIRWRQPVDEIFAWLKRTPGAEVKQHGDVSYIEVPLAMMGPVKTCICRFNDHTLMWTAGEDGLRKRLDQLAVPNDPPAWQDAWKEVEGGLITAVVAEAQYKDAPEAIVDESDRLTREFFSKTRVKAVGADWQPNERGNATFKLKLRFDNEADARSMEAGVRRMLEMAVQELREDASKASEEKGKVFANSLIALLLQARIETRITDNGWQIDLQLSGPIDIESNL